MAESATTAHDHGLGPQDAQSQSQPARVRPSLSLAAKYASKLPVTSVNSFCGAMAGVASGIVTCPLDVIKTKLQAQGAFRQKGQPSSSVVYKGLIGTARTVIKQDGLRGMYRGLGPMLLGYLPTWAVYMSVYDGSREYYYTQVGESSLPHFFLEPADALQTTSGLHAYMLPSLRVPARPLQQTLYGSSRHV